MSSVSSKSGTSGQDEGVRQAREDYRKKEAELIKKHNKEIKAMNDRYVQDIDHKDSEQSRILDEARKKSQEALTKRDLQYKKDVEEMRAMQAKQHERMMQENNDRLNTQIETARHEVKQANMGKEDRVQSLHDQYEEQHTAETKKFSDALEKLRNDQKGKVDEIRSSMKKTHANEAEKMRDERNEKVANLRNDNRRMYENTVRRIKDQEISHLRDKRRMENSSMDSHLHESEAHNNIQNVTREGYEQSVKELRNRMTKGREGDLKNQNEIFDDFKSNVDSRIDSQVNRLKRELSHAKEKNLVNKAEEERDSRVKVNNIRDTYQAKYDQLEKARLDTVRQSNEISTQKVRKIHEQDDRIMAENSRYYRSRMEGENFKNHQAVDNLEQDFSLRQKYTAENAQNRIERIRSEANEKEVALRENFKANIDDMKESSANEKKEIRMAMQKEHGEASRVMKSQAQKQVITDQRHLEDTVAKYEKRISEMNDQFMREKRLRDNREKTLLKSMGRQKDTEVDAVRLHQEEMNKQAQAAHDREIQAINRSYQEKLDEVIRGVRKS